MNCACSCGLLKSVAAVGGLVIVGLGGYNLITTGCPLGTCSAEAQLNTSLTPVSGTSELGACCGGPVAECTTDSVCEEGAEKKLEEAKDSETANTADETAPAAPETVAGLGG